MPTINVTGQGERKPSAPTASPSIPPGVRSEVPWMRPDYSRAWEQREAAQRRSSGDFERAVRQREQQMKRNQREEQRIVRDQTRMQTQVDRERSKFMQSELRAFQRDRAALDRAAVRRDPMTHLNRYVTNLGTAGFRAAMRGDSDKLARIDADLRRIEKVARDQFKLDTSTTQSIHAARKMVGAGQKYGPAIGGAQGALHGPESAIGKAANVGLDAGARMLGKGFFGTAAGVTLIAGALTAKALKEFAKSPITIASKEQQIIASASPYIRMRLGAAQLGRAGRFDSLSLQNEIYNGAVAPRWMTSAGITSADEALSLLRAYGVPVRSAAEAKELLSKIGSTSLSPGVGLSASRIAESAGLARTLGVTGANPQSWFRQLEKIMTTATAHGLDQAQSLRTVESLLRNGAAAGAASVGSRAISSFFDRAINSGLPGMRSGEGVASAIAGMNSAIGSMGIGGSPTRNNMMLSYFNRNGGMPTTAAALEKFLGIGDAEWSKMLWDPGTRRMIDNYLAAAKSGQKIFAVDYLKPFLLNRPELMDRIFNGSVYGQFPAVARPLAEANVTGLGYPGVVAVQTPHGSGPLGARLHNPLNLTYAGQPGAAPYRSGKHVFASFKSMEAGVAADYQQLRSYQSRGLNTVRKIVSRWAPKADGNDVDAYVAYVSSQLGIDPDAPLDLRNEDTAVKLIRAMAKREVGRAYAPSAEVIRNGVRMANGQPPIVAPNRSDDFAEKRGVTVGRSGGFANGGNPNVPADVYRSLGNANAAGTAAGEYSYNVLGRRIGEQVGEAANAVATAMTKTSRELDDFGAALKGAAAAVRAFVPSAHTGPLPVPRVGPHTSPNDQFKHWMHPGLAAP